MSSSDRACRTCGTHRPGSPELYILRNICRRYRSRTPKEHRTENRPTEEPIDYRFPLANERTFLAWIRTSLGLLAVHALAGPAGAAGLLHVAALGCIAMAFVLAADSTARRANNCARLVDPADLDAHTDPLVGNAESTHADAEEDHLQSPKSCTVRSLTATIPPPVPLCATIPAVVRELAGQAAVRVLLRIPAPQQPVPRVVSVDDFAIRRRRRPADALATAGPASSCFATASGWPSPRSPPEVRQSRCFYSPSQARNNSGGRLRSGERCTGGPTSPCSKNGCRVIATGPGGRSGLGQ
ncbi:YidH family protein [Nocardia sp. NPDC059091]|uniref:YidH family protein n=1 Tax=unclassified Nocardia TaxID=2637762 RepID=UPI0036BDF4E8